MATTIQIDEEIKRELFLLKNELERDLARSLTYNELIRILLDRNKKRQENPKKWQEFRKLKGSLSKDSIEILNSERAIDKNVENSE